MDACTLADLDFQRWLGLGVEVNGWVGLGDVYNRVELGGVWVVVVGWKKGLRRMNDSHNFILKIFTNLHAHILQIKKVHFWYTLGALLPKSVPKVYLFWCIFGTLLVQFSKNPIKIGVFEPTRPELPKEHCMRELWLQNM